MDATKEAEQLILAQLQCFPDALTPSATRLRRRILLRQAKRRNGMPICDIDTRVQAYLSKNPPMIWLSPRKKEQPTVTTDIKEEEREMTPPRKTPSPSPKKPPTLPPPTADIPYASSFCARIHGVPGRGRTMANPTRSNWRGRTLRPYIYRETHPSTPWTRLMHDLHADRPPAKSIDYVYLQRPLVSDVNALLQHVFWPGIDMSGALVYPDFSVVAIYGQLVVGCAFMTPEGYITYVAVRPHWERGGIGEFMIWQLIQAIGGSMDITLHVSPTNPAMILYQRFGFKPEEYIVGFYGRYLAPDSQECQNAFLMRLRR